MSNAIARTTLAPATFAEAMQFSQQLAKSSMIPRDYQNRPENVLIAIQWGYEVGLGPLQALQNIAVINGRPSVWGDSMLALVRGSPLCEDVQETIEGEGDAMVATCIAKRKGAAPVKATFSVADAKKAGLWGKSGPWQTYPKRMLQMRARGFALRDAFPDALRGVISREEAMDMPPERDVAATVVEHEATPPAAPEPQPTPALPPKVAAARDALIARFRAAATVQDVFAIIDDEKAQQQRQWLEERFPPVAAEITREADAAVRRTRPGEAEGVE